MAGGLDAGGIFFSAFRLLRCLYLQEQTAVLFGTESVAALYAPCHFRGTPIVSWCALDASHVHSGIFFPPETY